MDNRWLKYTYIFPFPKDIFIFFYDIVEQIKIAILMGGNVEKNISVNPCRTRITMGHISFYGCHKP